MNKVYFWYSLLFIASRTSATNLIASRIQISSKAPFAVFRTIPSEGWNEELQRFFNELKAETNALSGLGFFIVTRMLLLASAAAIITYLLVLLQFNSSDVDWEHLVNCE